MTSIESHGIAVEAEPGQRNKLARLAGFLYLAFILLFIFATVVQHKPIVPGDAAATARNIVDSEEMFRVGYTSELVSAFLFLSAAWALYVLLKPVGRNLALLFLLLNLAGVAVECVCAMVHFAALLVLGRPDYLNTFKPDQLQALAMLLLSLGGSGNTVLTLFYGVWLFPLGYLVFKSGFLPRALGVLLLLDGAGMTICFLQINLFPGHEKLTYPLYPIMFIAEFGLSIWLIVKGAGEPKASRHTD
jgi:hypothetical protein